MRDWKKENEIIDLTSALHPLRDRQSSVLCRIADSQGIIGSFKSEDVDLYDPRVNPKDREQYVSLSHRIYSISLRVDVLKYGEDEAYLRRSVWDYLKFLTLEDTIELFRKVGVSTTHEFLRKILNDPILLDEVMV